MTGNFPGKLVLSLRQTDFQTLRAVKIGLLPCGGHASSAMPQGHWLHQLLILRRVSLALLRPTPGGSSPPHPSRPDGPCHLLPKEKARALIVVGSRADRVVRPYELLL